MLQCEGFSSKLRYEFEIPNGENVRNWVANVVLKFNDDPTVNKSEIVIFLRQIWWAAGKRKGFERRRKTKMMERRGTMTTEEPIIGDNVSDFSDDEQQHDFGEHGEPSNQSTIVKYKTSSSMEEGDDNPPRVILNRVFWAFNPCIEGFKYCKPLVQVDETFLIGKYHGTLLTAIGQDDRGTGLLAALQFERVGWNGPDVSSMYCIHHIASNFNKQFKNVDLKKQVINMEFPQATDWLDQIPKSKWTQAYDEGKQYGHMTTNLAECMNSVLKGARALPITALVNETFNKINDSFVTNDIKIMNMIKAGHSYSEDVYVMMQENQHIATSHYVRMYGRETGEFEIEREKKSPDKVLPEPLLDKVLPELLDRVVKSLDVCNAFTLGLDAVKTLGGALVSTESQSLSTSKVLSLRPRRLPPTLTLGPTL
ncbi:hypothetical protein D0Y65_050901 [Glycine soja]|uniref:Uncharacterized protein n=1 Tax=Glycine soja TaxID=3848 RepID=A0A445FDZ5_GLYSO|nr:hypothetical protein D0Y65_050901 [Glycine soja]